MGLKRKLFTEHPSGPTIHEVSVAPTRRAKRNISRNTKVAMVEGDSLANVLQKKKNSLPKKATTISRQLRGITNNARNEEYLSHSFKPSVLMALDTKTKTSGNSNGREQTKVKRRQKVKPSQVHANRTDESRPLTSNILGDLLTYFDAETRFESSSQRASRGTRRTVPLTKIATRSKTNSKYHNRNIRNKMTTNRVRLQDSIPTCDSLMMCLTRSSTVATENLLMVTDCTRRAEKACNQRRKRGDNCNNKNLSNTRAKQSAKISQLDTKELKTLNRISGSSCMGSGLGAFVGVSVEGLHHGNPREESSIQGFVSSVERGSKMDGCTSVRTEEETLSTSLIDRTTNKTTRDVSKPCGLPADIVVSMPQPIAGFQLSEGSNHFKDKPIAEASCTSLESLRSVEMRPRNETNEFPKDSKVIRISRKYDIGTIMQKHFCNHGWFTGKIISFEPETGFYMIRYEDGDVEELEERELEECEIQSNDLDTARPNQNGQKLRKTNSIIDQEDDKKLKKHSTNDLKQNLSHANETQSALDKIVLEDSAKKTLRTNDVKYTKKSRHQIDKTAPLKRSSRRSSEPIRLLEPTKSTSSKRHRRKITDSYLRRSKRRRSKPIRLGYIERKQVNRSIEKDKCKPKSKVEKNQSNTIKDPKSPVIYAGRESTCDKAVNSTTNRNHSLSRSHCGYEHQKKQHFDDALKAVMPLESNAKQLVYKVDQIEDDIFDSTPMRKLFAKTNSNIPPIATGKQKEEKDSEPRRSRRKSLEPDRYGHFVDSSTTCTKRHARSAIQKRKGNKNSTAKKRVRISNEQPEAKIINSEENKEDDLWTQADLRALHRSHRIVNPKSYSFWEDVSEIMGNRSAMECRQKWFSLAKTPEPKKTKQGNSDIVTSDHMHSFDDDIFNSTPMRSAFAIGESNNNTIAAFEELGDVANMEFESAIKIKKLDRHEGILPSNQDLISCPRGYKTYLQKLGRSMRQKDTKKRQVFIYANQNKPTIGKKLAEHIDAGDVRVKCKLSPGGTLQVDTLGDTDTEEYLDYDDDEE